MIDEDLLEIRKYKNIKDPIKKNLIKDKIIQEFLPVVRYAAKKIHYKLPSNVELDDLISFGVLGLMDALEKFDPKKNNKFRTYAEFRIRGSILDHLRSEDFVPRSVRSKIKELTKVIEILQQKLNRPPLDEEIMESLKISSQDYYDLLDRTKKISFIHIDKQSDLKKIDQSLFLKISKKNENSTPHKNLLSAFDHKKVLDIVKTLPERHRMVLSLYYFEDLSLKEIGKILQITESRVSQIHSKGVEYLKELLKQEIDLYEEDIAA